MEQFRIIPTLLIENDYLVKSEKFKNNRYIGDPINAIKILNEKEIDELVVLDISASKTNSEPNYKLIEELASECFMPLSYGGGITSIECAQKLFRSGVEKIIINSACFSNPNLIAEITQKFGNQSVTISIDVKKNIWGSYYVYSHTQRDSKQYDPVSFAIEMEKLGAGEIILNSVDNDGTYKGYDTELIRLVSLAVSIPVIALGGAGNINDFKKAIQAGASAVAAGSLFCFYGRLKAVLINYPSQEEIKRIFSDTQSTKKNLNILHVTAWYPNKKDSHKALFIKEHFESIDLICNNHLLHIDTNPNEKNFVNEKFKLSENEETIIFKFPFKIWFLVELISFFILLRYSIKNKVQTRYDIVNFHIAYPLGVYLHIYQKLFKKPIIISEHWTAYHYDFYIKKQKRGINRIKNIFKREIPVIVVSEALANDIKKFSGNDHTRFHILNNIVDSTIFNCKNESPPEHPTFFMLNMWSKIKQPFVGIDAFELFVEKHPEAKLKIGGFGPIWKDIEDYVKLKKLEHSIELLGRMNKNQIAEHLNSCTALLHTSKYETFSVISAEAASCGAPVIAMNLGGIPSFINQTNGYLHNNDTIEGWLKGMEYVYENKNTFDRKAIALEANRIFSKQNVGKRYYKILKQEFRTYFENKRQ
ncbi:MAG: imidazole glycerol phosphate synthase subunit HisF [Bacteroidetes bacterium]|nr:imidazole glycerol phosphate synthase subunit HisF [Bacteroidota bacterium]